MEYDIGTNAYHKLFGITRKRLYICWMKKVFVLGKGSSVLAVYSTASGLAKAVGYSDGHIRNLFLNGVDFVVIGDYEIWKVDYVKNKDLSRR